MKNTNEMNYERMLECIELAGLTADQQQMADSYFKGELESLEMEVSEKRNILELHPDKRDTIRRNADKIRKISNKDFAKLFKVLFDVFGVGMVKLFWVYDFSHNPDSDDKLRHMPRAEYMAFLVELQSQASYNITREKVKELVNISGDNELVWDRALTFANTKNLNGKRMLYAAYFAHKKNTENTAYFEDYEQLIVNEIQPLFANKLSVEEYKIIFDFINADENAQRSPELCKILNSHRTNDGVLKRAVACAILNYKLSSKLRNFLKLCAYGKTCSETLDVVRNVNGGGNLGDFIMELKTDLQLEPVQYLKWCGNNDMYEILRKEVYEDIPSYIQAINGVASNHYITMLSVAKGTGEEYYNEHYKPAIDEQRDSKKEKLIRMIEHLYETEGASSEFMDKLRLFLLGEIKADELYTYQKELLFNIYFQHIAQVIENYEFAYGNDIFSNRCRIYMAMDYDFHIAFNGYEDIKGEKRQEQVFKFFEDLDEAGVTTLHQFKIAISMYNTFSRSIMEYSFIEKAQNNELVKNLCEKVFKSHMEKADEQGKAEVFEYISNKEHEEKALFINILEGFGDTYKAELFGYFADNSKFVRNHLAELISQHEEWSTEVLEKLSSKKGAERETAIAVISKFKGDYTQQLMQALENEKSKRIADQIRDILKLETVKQLKRGEVSTDAYVEEIHKGNKKRGLQWAYETPFSEVHYADGSGLASEEYMQAILLTYSGMKLAGYNKEVFTLTNKLNKTELARYVNELFDKWLDDGAVAKQKWVLFAAAVHGGVDIVDKIKHQIDDWAKNSRGAIASDAVKALALNDTPTALLIVDGIARKYKFKQVKAAAGVALENAAKELGLSTEELADKIVPDLGFNENMERVFDYGERKFKVCINPALEMEVYDMNDKKLKNLPAPGKKDDEVKANEAYTEFKQLKKLMKTTVTSQKQRLEHALSVERKWSASKWKDLFVKNPIMHQFAISLIWGCYENGKLKETFRYMEDGTFNTVDEDEYELLENATIGLVHPIELTEEVKKQWEDQLEDYEIIQSIEQLKRPVYKMTDEEMTSKTLERFGGLMLNGLSLSGKLIPMGWSRGMALDAGVYVVFYREDTECDMGVALDFSGVSMGYENEETTIYIARFYRPSTAKRGGFSYDFIEDKECCTLGEVPPRYFSEIVYQLTKATASSEEKDENWRDEFNRYR